MRFEFYSDALDSVPKLSVDGTVSNSVHFSHWNGNETAPELKADTSTEIALNLVTSPNRSELTKGIDLVTNNHFDTDGMLSVWTVMNGDRAAQYRDVLIAAAEAGDFSEYSSADGVRISLAIQGSDTVIPGDDAGSPLARMLAGEEVNDDARCYQLILPEVERLLTNINAYEPLWREGWTRIVKALESFDRGSSKVVEFEDSCVSVVTLAPDIFSGEGFNPTRHSAHTPQSRNSLTASCLSLLFPLQTVGVTALTIPITHGPKQSCDQLSNAAIFQVPCKFSMRRKAIARACGRWIRGS